MAPRPDWQPGTSTQSPQTFAACRYLLKERSAGAATTIEATPMRLVSRVSDRADALERRREENAMRRAARQAFAQILQPGS